MSTLSQEYPTVSVRQLCALLGVSRSWFYQRPRAPTQAERDIALRDVIEYIVLEFPGYGYRRVTAELHRQQWTVNHQRPLLEQVAAGQRKPRQEWRAVELGRLGQLVHAERAVLRGGVGVRLAGRQVCSQLGDIQPVLAGRTEPSGGWAGRRMGWQSSR